MKDDNSTPEPPHVVFVTASGSIRMPYEPDRTIRATLREAFEVTFGTKFEINDYTVASTDGDPLPLSDTMGEAGVVDGDDLFVHPNPVQI